MPPSLTIKSHEKGGILALAGQWHPTGWLPCEFEHAVHGNWEWTYNNMVIPSIMEITVTNMFVSLRCLRVQWTRLSEIGMASLMIMTPAKAHIRLQRNTFMAIAMIVLHAEEKAWRQSWCAWNATVLLTSVSTGTAGRSFSLSGNEDIVVKCVWLLLCRDSGKDKYEVGELPMCEDNI